MATRTAAADGITGTTGSVTTTAAAATTTGIASFTGTIVANDREPCPDLKPVQRGLREVVAEEEVVEPKVAVIWPPKHLFW